MMSCNGWCGVKNAPEESSSELEGDGRRGEDDKSIPGYEEPQQSQSPQFQEESNESRMGTEENNNGSLTNGGNGKNGCSTGDSHNHIRIPDLNTSSGGSSEGNEVGRRVELSSGFLINPMAERLKEKTAEEILNEEVSATIEMGDVLGVNLRDREEHVRKVILGEETESGCP
ncbi:hypothetical protein L1987_21383 [Smallanthus sonchifolius]|uniref:Uncharacterized protein n=1 Tax=Smallanthus sonchifolius TaxID=185202 RepID=A0ACB9IUY3_9ASTR|nr:hypothetical protein L1987_21383 [Smallanthus sonchifolius]